jgi:hypothetical protein
MHLVQAAVTYLIIITPQPSGKHTHVFEYPSQSACRQALIEMRVEPSKSPSGNGIVAFCSPTSVPVSPSPPG